MAHGRTAGIRAEDDRNARRRGVHQPLIARGIVHGALPFLDLPFRDAVLAGNLRLALPQHRRERGHDGNVLGPQELNGGAGHAAPVLHDVNAETRDAVDGVVVRGVRRDRQAVAVRFVDDGFQFGIREFQRVVAGHNLDEIRAGPHLFAYGAPHFVRPAGLAAAPIGVAARLHDRLAGNEQARTGKDALLHRLLGVNVGLVHAQIPDRRHPGPQADPHVAGGLVGADLRRVVQRLARQIVNAVPRQMRMAVEQAGQQRPARGLHVLRARAEVGDGAHGGKAAVPDFHEAVRDGFVADACQDQAAQNDVLCGDVNHGLDQFLKAPRGLFRHFPVSLGRMRPVAIRRSPYFRPNSSRARAAPSRLDRFMPA